MVVRRRLHELLDEGAQRALTLISAPPGAGKTVLLGSWIASGGPPGPVAWLSLDPADADRRRFWRAVLEALDRAGAGEAVAALAAHPQGRVDRLTSALITALDARDEPVVLVLDDFHEVAEALAATSTSSSITRRPPCGLVIATRADPPLRLGGLRLSGIR